MLTPYIHGLARYQKKNASFSSGYASSIDETPSLDETSEDQTLLTLKEIEVVD